MSVLVPKKGYTENPMLEFPRNDRCPCDSGKKFKKCCYLKQQLFIDQEVAKGISVAVKTYKEKHGKK
jgi:hypothetical protein